MIVAGRNDENNIFFVAADDCIIITRLQIFGGEEGKEKRSDCHWDEECSTRLNAPPNPFLGVRWARILPFSLLTLLCGTKPRIRS
jgi:hypothetical protein